MKHRRIGDTITVHSGAPDSGVATTLHVAFLPSLVLHLAVLASCHGLETLFRRITRQFFVSGVGFSFVQLLSAAHTTSQTQIELTAGAFGGSWGSAGIGSGHDGVGVRVVGIGGSHHCTQAALVRWAGNGSSDMDGHPAFCHHRDTHSSRVQGE